MSHPRRCECCGRPIQTETVAERLLDIADLLRSDPDVLVIADGGVTSTCLARVKTALDLSARPGLVLRAIVEEWDHIRINREMY